MNQQDGLSNENRRAFWHQAVQLLQESGLTTAAFARREKLSPQTLSKWKIHFLGMGIWPGHRVPDTSAGLAFRKKAAHVMAVSGRAKPASNPPTGSEASVSTNSSADSVPSDGVLVAQMGMTVPPPSGAACQEVSRSGPASTCEPYRFIIEEKLSRGAKVTSSNGGTVVLRLRYEKTIRARTDKVVIHEETSTKDAACQEPCT